MPGLVAAAKEAIASTLKGKLHAKELAGDEVRLSWVLVPAATPMIGWVAGVSERVWPSLRVGPS